MKERQWRVRNGGTLSVSSGSCWKKCRFQLNTFAKKLREGSDLAKTLLVQALLHIHQKDTAIEYEITCGTGTIEDDRQNQMILKEGA